MVPPQDNPTFQAVSSATPNSSTRGLPLSITSIASVTTAPSTQPPDTEPRKFPSLSMTRLEPTGRGAEPQVSTTVASATPRPAFRQSSAAFRMSSSRPSMSVSVDVLRHALQPGLGIDLTAMHRQRLAKLRYGIQIVDRPQFVNMRQHHFNAARLGLETIEPQQRIEPDQPAAGAVQPVDLKTQAIVGIALQPIREQQHDCALRQHPARPQFVENGERGGDAGAAGPVHDARRAGFQRFVGILGLERAR